ncbi:MAG: cytochrome ubiquinol oxidase subunit I [Alphaproteobacteria bacterium]|nr:cytochrome ubiquinol oxidase subunit I [Alphaproteobacteria bacterium]
MEFDPALLARIQFAFTISFHILFPSLTIGLASWLAFVEGLWLKTGNETYRDIYKLWVKIFAVTFGMGVVSGVVMSYQFGTNWSVFSDRTGSVLGPLLAFEVLTAFFLEASFLGVMIFGWDRVTPRMHFLSTVIVASGTVISAFWILSANSWMQTPTGYEIGADNLFLPLNWVDIIFNPSFLYRLFHMVTAAYLTTAFFVGGIGAWYFLKKRHLKQARIMVGMAMFMAVFVSPIQIFLGDLHGLNTFKYQPQKIAAIEAIWDTGKDVPFVLVGWPDERTETTQFAVTIPYLTSLLLTHEVGGECRGLKSWPKSERPPVLPVFWSFRIMVGIGLLMLLTGLMAIVLYFRNQLFTQTWFQYWCLFMTPSGFIAVLAGWFVTEIGRQPYIVYGLMRTLEARSPVIGQHVFLSLVAFIFVYTFVFGTGIYYIAKLIRKGPSSKEKKEDIYGSHGLKTPRL